MSRKEVQEYDFAVVGCGVFGLSSALELKTRFPEKSVLALDAFEVPSAWSAANDYNKIIRAEYADMVYSRLALEAMKLWEEDKLYSPHFVKSGRFTLSPVNASNAHRLKYENQGVQNLIKLGMNPGKISLIKDLKTLTKVAPEFKDSTLFDQNLEVKYNPDAGYGIARDSLKSVYDAARAKGVIFRFNDDGHIVELDQINNILVVKSGLRFKAKQVAVCMGASTGYLLNLNNQIRSTGLFVTHLQLSDTEFDKYKNIPVFFSAEYGYFFPPDPQTKKLKFAMTFCDCKYTVYNDRTNETLSLPRYKTEFTNDTFPKAEGIAHVHRLLQLTLPELASHQLIESKTCWISDTVDSHFLIDFIPNSKSIIVATGDSGHGYKFLPNIGKYIVDKLTGKLQKELEDVWRWRVSPKWPQDPNKSRAQRPHYEMKDINDWYVESTSRL